MLHDRFQQRLLDLTEQQLIQTARRFAVEAVEIVVDRIAHTFTQRFRTLVRGNRQIDIRFDC